MAPPPNYIYIPDLIKEVRMSYFKIPKLGAYIAFPMKFNSYLKVENKKQLFLIYLFFLKEEFFNDALSKR